MHKVENIVENELPNKRAAVGAISLTPDKILLFGGISEQQGCSRDTCYVYDINQGSILKTAEIKMKQRDSFPHEGYSYYEDETSYIVAGRYYIHRLYKQTMTWDEVPNDVQREIEKTASDQREDHNLMQKNKKKEMKKEAVQYAQQT